MEPWRKLLVHVAWMGAAISGCPGVVVPLAAQQAAASAPQNSTSSTRPLLARVEAPAISELPDSPGAVVAKPAESSQQQGSQQNSGQASVAQNAPAQPAQAQSPTQSQPPAQRPVGTAASEAPNASGVAASQPAGVAIAPVKQRRTRTLILRTGALIGAGIAVGSVVALTAGTSSKPPGAH